MQPDDALRAAHTGLWLDLWWASVPPPDLTRFNAAIMDGDAQPTLTSLLAQHVPLPADPSEPLLSLAVVRPETIGPLLAAGAPVNAVNAIGKTPLMYAAQLDALDAVRQLLAGSTDVNAVSLAPGDIVGNSPVDPDDPLSGCGAYAITHGSRTALMYAAANASLPLIRLLVAAGADPSLADSKGNTALDYLEGRGPVSANLHLTAASLDEARALLTRH